MEVNERGRGEVGSSEEPHAESASTDPMDSVLVLRQRRDPNPNPNAESGAGRRLRGFVSSSGSVPHGGKCRNLGSWGIARYSGET
jgi:hypothetical protein